MRERKPRARFWLGVLILTLTILSAVFIEAAPLSAQEGTEPADVIAQAGSDFDAPISTADHSEFAELAGPFATGPDVTAACLNCHTEAAEQMMATTHWTWEAIAPDGGEVGKNNVINNYCVAVTSNEPRCTSCHTGYGYTNSSFDFSVETNVDCLVCHDTTGTYKKFPTGAGHPVYEPKEFPAGSGNIWQPPDLALVAQNVGETSRETCGACHFYGGGGDGVKHGDLDSSMANPSFDLDVHMSPDGEDFTCTTCHTADNHQISGSRYEMAAHDTGEAIPAMDEDLATCESCHGTEPMADPKLNDHVDTIACQTCHIPEFARELPTKMWWDWSKAGQMNAEGVPYAEKDDNGWVVYDTKKGEFVWEMNVQPDYVWFDGNVSYLAATDTIDPDSVVDINTFHGSPDDGVSRIWPVKTFTGIQPYDAGNNVLAIPHLFGSDDAAYWKTYNWDAALAAGMATAGYDYSGEYGWVETQMLWPTTHMVAPAEDALQCESCHTDDGRLENVAGVYIPGRDNNAIVDNLGWGILGLALVGVVIHGGARIALGNRREER